MNQPLLSATSRRTFLRSALALAVASPVLAACSDDSPTAPSADATGTGSFPGVTLNVACNPTSIQACTEAGKQWAKLTGGTVKAQVIPFAERATSYASWIVSKDN